MPEHKIVTKEGELRLVTPDLADLQEFRRVWPFGMVRFREQDGADTGIVLQCGSREVVGFKFQPGDVPEEETAMFHLWMHRRLIARSMADWLNDPPDAALLPVVYVRNKGGLGFESGIACFCYLKAEAQSDPADLQEVVAQPSEKAREIAFEWYGSVARALKVLGDGYKITLIGIDVKRRSDLETIQMDFLAHGSRVYSVTRNVFDGDTIWEELVTAGVAELPHIPTVPFTIPPEDLRKAKGLEKFNS